jgi:hypothetical protein
MRPAMQALAWKVPEVCEMHRLGEMLPDIFAIIDARVRLAASLGARMIAGQPPLVNPPSLGHAWRKGDE